MPRFETPGSRCGPRRHLAVHATTGATRTLDSLESSPEALAPGGSVVYYDAIESDVYDLSVLARRVALGRTPAPHTLESCSGFCFHFIEPAPDGDLLAVGELGDSLRIYRLSTGERTVVSEYSPLAFSPHSDLLLVKDLFDPLSQARILTLATGSTTPAALGVPDTISGFRLRWGPAGIEVLYVGAEPTRSQLPHTERDSRHEWAWGAAGEAPVASHHHG